MFGYAAGLAATCRTERRNARQSVADVERMPAFPIPKYSHRVKVGEFIGGGVLAAK